MKPTMQTYIHNSTDVLRANLSRGVELTKAFVEAYRQAPEGEPLVPHITAASVPAAGWKRYSSREYELSHRLRSSITSRHLQALVCAQLSLKADAAPTR